jgi:predicted amidohydrolase
LSALDIIAAESAQRLDDGKDHAGIVRLVLAFRNISTGVHREYAGLMDLAGLNPSEIYQALTHDLDHIVSFAVRVSRAKQMKIGTGLVS